MAVWEVVLMPQNWPSSWKTPSSPTAKQTTELGNKWISAKDLVTNWRQRGCFPSTISAIFAEWVPPSGSQSVPAVGASPQAGGGLTPVCIHPWIWWGQCWKWRAILQTCILNISMDICTHVFEGVKLRGIRMEGVLWVYNSKTNKYIPKCYVR